MEAVSGGYGYGLGDGSGDGYGSGYGYGYGYGDFGDPVTTVGEHALSILNPWRLVKVGCQVHSLAEWRERWPEIARAEGVEIDAAEAERLLALAATALEATP